MGGERVIRGLLGFWGGLQVLAFWQFFGETGTEPAFRGLMQLLGFLAWQAAAGVVAIVLLVMARRGLERGETLRWVAQAPAVIAALLALGVGGMVGWSALGMVE